MPMSQSWVDGANEPHGFGLNHLPFGAFCQDDQTRLCVRIGEFALDLEACERWALLDELSSSARRACTEPDLHALLAEGPEVWRALRALLTGILDGTETAAPGAADILLVPLKDVELVLPIRPRGYTDFYACLHHARRVGEIFRPESPLLPNYKHIPIGYNGRASSIVASGTPVVRPRGQRKPVGQEMQPVFEATRALDYELELAFVAGWENALGSPIPISEAREHLFGVTLLNDWSARDIQSWEYQPLGPFLGKSFATSISPWITPMAALEPFQLPMIEREAQDPRPLPYLWDENDQKSGAMDIKLTVALTTEASRAARLAPFPISQSNARDLYWTPAQMLTHLTSNGCNIEPGDLLGSGTISGASREAAGCLLERTRNGAEPLVLPNGERRSWLEDGDEVILTARCEREGQPFIELGTCTGKIVPAS